MFLKIVIFTVTIFALSSAIRPTSWEPVAKPYAFWINAHKSFVNQTVTLGKQIRVVFFGASLIEGWRGNGKEVWQQFYAKRGAVNYGIGGDMTQNLIYRIKSNEVTGLDPKLVVFNIGSNNLWGFTASELALGINAVIITIKKELPKTKILYLNVFPRNDWKAKIKETNALIRRFGNNNTVQYLDLAQHLENSNGTLKEGLYVPDGVHLTKEGYKVWANAMEPTIKKMLGEE